MNIRKFSKLLRPTITVNNYHLRLTNDAPVPTSTLELMLSCLTREEVEPCTKEGREDGARSVDFYHWSTTQQLNNSRQNETFQVRISFSSNFLWNFRGWSFDFLQDAAAPPPGGHLLWILLERSSWRWLFSSIMSLVNICLLRGDFSFQQCFFSILLLMTIAVYLVSILSSNVSVWEELDIELPLGDFLKQKNVYFKKKESYFYLLPL